MGIGNVLFGDEGIGAHMANLLQEKYIFTSDEHEVDVIDGGTLAQRLIPIITDGYERVVLIDCVNVDDSSTGDVYCFDFDKVPDYITWSGSAHEVEMLQTLQMTQLMGDLPPVKIVGVIPFVIGSDSTFSMTDEVVKAALTMEKTIIDYVESFGIKAEIKNNLKLRDVSENTYIKGFDACY